MSRAEWLVGLSLVHGPIPLALTVGAVLGLLVLLVLRRSARWWTRGVPAAAVASAVVLGLALLTVRVTKPFPDPVPTSVVLWTGLAVLGVALLAVGWRHHRWSARILAVLATMLVVLGAGVRVDGVYGAFPTIATALQLPPHDAAGATVPPPVAHTMPAVTGRPLDQQWHPAPGMPTHGAVVQVDIPPTHSGFHARPAWIYLPPAYLTPNRPLLPVLELLGGQPGSSRDWLDGGQLAQRMDAWASAHNGLAPVVVMPDALGGEVANPLCLDSALGQADTYLSRDVPEWVTAHLQIDSAPAHWAVGGFSFGGTCALQLATAHPQLFPTFFDASGQAGPTLGDPARTVAAAFPGNAAAFAAVDPLQELATRRYPDSAGYFLVGADDPGYVGDAHTVVTAAQAAGMTVVYRELPGGHSYQVWGPGFDGALPWLSVRLGLTA
ncbi:MAG: xynZ [Modestobacter sp.]|jgi:S-formylglutathione hydrolase FrmB|nr:xynZ [Modestobacter sp.]